MTAPRSLFSGRFDEKDGTISLTVSVKHEDDTNLMPWKVQKDIDVSRLSLAETVDSSASFCSSGRSNCSDDEWSTTIPDATVVSMTDADTYGQRHPVESGSLILLKLENFEYEVKMLDCSSKVSLAEAVLRCPELLTDKFKLMFLRCECFNGQKAAKRYATYWDMRLEIFGPSRAFQPITLESMSKGDMRPLELGALQVIRRSKTSSDDKDDERDMLWVDPSKLDPSQYSRQSGCRAFWYFFHSLLEDEQVQKRGLVIINYSANFSNKNRDPTFVRMCLNSMQGCLPIRLSSIHGCHPPPLYRWVTRLFLLFIGERLRKRIQVHSGTREHVVDLLVQKYSIPRDCLPEDLGGDREMDILGWLAERRAAGL